MEQSEIHTYVPLLGGLPFEVVVLSLESTIAGGEDTRSHQCQVVSCGLVALATIGSCIQTIAGIIGDSLVTGLTPRCTDLPIIQPFLVNMLRNTIT